MKLASFTALTLLTSVVTYAQDVDIDISSDGISIDTEQWYENPIVWVGGIVLLVLLIVLISRSRKAT